MSLCRPGNSQDAMKVLSKTEGLTGGYLNVLYICSQHSEGGRRSGCYVAWAIEARSVAWLLKRERDGRQVQCRASGTTSAQTKKSLWSLIGCPLLKGEKKVASGCHRVSGRTAYRPEAGNTARIAPWTDPKARSEP